MLDNLILCRKKYKIQQSEIAEVINKTNKTVSLKENGKIPITRDEMIKITAHIKKKYNPNITVEDIFFKNNTTESVV